jgi:isopentenyl-diphosphate Delta-isomerase
MKNPSQKQVALIDSQNNVLGGENLYTAHAHPAQLHRAVSVWLVRNQDSKRQILLQRRSKKKIVGGDQWGNAICGNVRPNETFLECAQRRLGEEIGVYGVELEADFRFEYKIYSNEKYGEHELDQVYLGEYDGEFELDPDEASAVEWVDMIELKQEVAKHAIMNASETLKYETNQLKDLTPALELQLGGKDFEITPWTSLMLGDKKLWEMLEKN